MRTAGVSRRSQAMAAAILGRGAGVALRAAVADPPNFLIQQNRLGIHYSLSADLTDYLVDADLLQIADGYVALPTSPGLGLRVDEAAVREASAPELDWGAPAWTHRDGPLAES
ncbi:hypothetical protein [Kribbella swartbergensis]